MKTVKYQDKRCVIMDSQTLQLESFWFRSISPYRITRPQWVKLCHVFKPIQHTQNQLHAEWVFCICTLFISLFIIYSFVYLFYHKTSRRMAVCCWKYLHNMLVKILWIFPRKYTPTLLRILDICQLYIYMKLQKAGMTQCELLSHEYKEN